MRRTLIIGGLLLLVLFVPPLSANPGGNGDANRDAACGGSCHGDPGLSEPSSAVLSFSQDRDSAYVVAQFRLVSPCLKWNCLVVQWSVFSY